jgi:hypothetical protein
VEGVLFEEDADVTIGTIPEADSWIWPAMLDVEPAGDVDGDGITDLLLSYTTNYGHHGPNNLSTSLFYGPLDIWRYVSQADWTIGDYSGWSLDALGDVDGDGYDDFLVVGEGGVWIFQGPVAPSTGPTGASATVEIEMEPSIYHRDVYHAAGDVDGDGRADLLVANDAEPLPEDIGIARVGAV